MDTILCILGNIIGIAIVIFGIIYAIGMWNYISEVMGYNKKHDDDDDEIVIKYKIEDVEHTEYKRPRAHTDYDPKGYNFGGYDYKRPKSYYDCDD